jgi:tryptophan synthase alpha chain
LGYPDEATFLRICAGLQESGADALEIGFPFSDPMADGPTIQKSNFEVIQNGITGQAAWDLVAKIRTVTSIPLVLMGYLNPLLYIGLEQVAENLRASDVDGIIIPDVPPEEAEELLSAMRGKDLDTIFLVTPTTAESRLQKIVESSTGYIYLVSVTGITGARNKIDIDLSPTVESLRKRTSLPLCVGFGVSTPEQAGSLGGQCDGVIVGSALSKQLKEMMIQ